MTLADLIDRNAGFAPNKVALRFTDRVLTYRALASRIEALASGLSQEFGVVRGDRIAHLGFNSDDFLVLLFAAARLGAILVPVNWRLAQPEQVYILANAQPKVLAIDVPAFGDRLPALKGANPGMQAFGLGSAADGVAIDNVVDAGAHPRPGSGIHVASGGNLNDPLLIVYTSGTTGRPKGAMLTQIAIQANAVNATHMHGLTAADRVLTVLPLFHVGGLNIQTMPALIAGAEVTLLARFEPDAAFDAIAAHRPTLTVFVPPILQALLDHPRFAGADLTSLRAITTGSTIVPETLVTAYAARDLRVLQVYGATETGPIAVYERFDMPRGPTGSTGQAGLINAVRIVDERGQPVVDGVAGEIAVRGANLFAGYWRDPVATADAHLDGWFLSGDIGTRDAGGHFTVIERKKNVIISGGENIYAAEVERVIAAFPGIAECAVVGRPDSRWQEVPVAFVVMSGEPNALDHAALEAHLVRDLARYKIPREIVVRRELPKNALGKIQHFALRAELSHAGVTGKLADQIDAAGMPRPR